MPERLSQIERDTLLLLGKRGPGGDFDQMAMAKLFAIGLVEVSSSNRRLALTSEGRKLYELLRDSEGDARPQKKNSSQLMDDVDKTLRRIQDDIAKLRAKHRAMMEESNTALRRSKRFRKPDSE
jgi:hypothetical protein